MLRKIHLYGCHLGFKKLQIPYQTPNYQILLIYDIYNLNISRILTVDILVFIAAIQTLKNRKAGPSDPAFHRNFILCIALCYGCIPFIASIASSAEIMGLTLNLT